MPFFIIDIGISRLTSDVRFMYKLGFFVNEIIILPRLKEHEMTFEAHEKNLYI